MSFRLNRLTHSQIIATVFALMTMACPMAFAKERGKQLARQVLQQMSPGLAQLSTVFERPRTSVPILDQITNLNVGEPSIVGNTITLDRPEATYVFTDMAFDESGVSGTVTVYDLQGEVTSVMEISKLTLPDDNTVSYSVGILAGENAWTEDGVLTGVGDAGNAVVAVSTDGGETTQTTRINFRGLDVSQASVATGETCPITPQDGSNIFSGGEGGAASFVACAIVVVVVVLGVLITCLLFGWWGC